MVNNALTAAMRAEFSALDRPSFLVGVGGFAATPYFTWMPATSTTFAHVAVSVLISAAMLSGCCQPARTFRLSACGEVLHLDRFHVSRLTAQRHLRRAARRNVPTATK